jgi:hypothetical protein
MPRIEEFLVEQGEPIQPAWERLRDWVSGLTIQATGAARIMWERNSINVVYDGEDNVFRGKFSVSLAPGPAVTVGEGFVNGFLMPVINGLPIDGKKANANPQAPPQLKLNQVPPNKDMRSWICLQVVIDPKTDKLDTKNPSTPPLEIVHRNDWDQLSPGQDFGGYGYEALAMVVWKDKATVDRIHQIVMHNLKHAYAAPKTKGTKGRHFFSAQ